MLTGGLLLAIRRWRTSAQPPLMIALLGCLAFNAALHLLYGTELFLYTPNSTYALVLFLALAYSTLADRAWLRAGLTAFVMLFMLNNMQFLLGMLRAASPFFAAAY
jgi:hypothetical protein